jgi:hypothetical protein
MLEYLGYTAFLILMFVCLRYIMVSLETGETQEEPKP